MIGLRSNLDGVYNCFLFFIICCLIAPVLTHISTAVLFGLGGMVLFVYSIFIRREFFVTEYFSKLPWNLILPLLVVWSYYTLRFLITSNPYYGPTVGLMLYMISGFLIIGIVVTYANSSKKLTVLVKVLNIFFLFNIVIGLLQAFIPFNLVLSRYPDDHWFIKELMSKPYIPKSVFNGENRYSVSLVSYFPIYMLSNYRRYSRNFIVLIFVIVLCALTDGRGAYIGLLCFFLYLFIKHTKLFFISRKKNLRRYIFYAGAFVTVLSLPFILNVVQNKLNIFRHYSYRTNVSVIKSLVENFISDSPEISSESIRKLFILNALEEWSKDGKTILFGLGPTKSALISIDELTKLRNPPKPYKLTMIHNSFLELLTEGGVVTFVYVLLLFGFFAKKYFSVLSYLKAQGSNTYTLSTGILYGTVISLVVGGVVHHSIVWNYKGFYLFLGLFLCVINISSKEKNPLKTAQEGILGKHS